MDVNHSKCDDPFFFFSCRFSSLLDDSVAVFTWPPPHSPDFSHNLSPSPPVLPGSTRIVAPSVIKFDVFGLISACLWWYLLNETSEDIVLCLALLAQDEDVFVAERYLSGEVVLLLVELLEECEQCSAPLLQVSIHYYLYMYSANLNQSWGFENMIDGEVMNMW